MEGPELDETGLLYDFTELKKQLRATSEYLDHQFLNELKPFDQINPSAENIAKFFYDQLHKELKSGSIAYVRVWETDTACAVYRP